MDPVSGNNVIYMYYMTNICNIEYMNSINKIYNP